MRNFLKLIAIMMFGMLVSISDFEIDNIYLIGIGFIISIILFVIGNYIYNYNYKNDDEINL